MQAYCLLTLVFLSESPIIELLLGEMTGIEAGIPHMIECQILTKDTQDIELWINVNGRQLPQSMISEPNVENTTYYINNESIIIFDRSDHQKEVFCGVSWRNKVYTSEVKKVNVSCKQFLLKVIFLISSFFAFL